MPQPTSDHVPPARVTRYRRWLLWIALIALVPLILYCSRLIRESHAKKRLTAILQQIDANDPGWRLKNLQEEYEAREVDHELMKALQTFTQYYDDGNLFAQFWRAPNIRPSNEQMANLRRRHNAPGLSTLPQHFQTHRVQPQHRLAENYRGTSVQRKALREQFDYLMRYSLDELILAMQEGRGGDALSMLQSQLAWYDLFDDCPHLTTQDQGHQIFLTCGNHVQMLLAQGLYSDEQLVRLQKALIALDKDRLLKRLRTIRAEANDMLEKMQNDPIYRDDCFSAYFSTSLPSTAPWIAQAKLEVESWYHRQQAADSLFEAQAEVLEALEGVMKEVRKDSSKVIIRTTWPVTNRVAQKVLSDNYSTVYFYANAMAMLRSAAVAIACERYRLKTNRWPKSLDELVPQYLDKVPLDPYTGKPLLFKLLADGAVVYSVGYNLKDDR